MDLERLQKLSYEDKVKEMAAENQQLRKRNGQLMIELEEARSKLTDTKQHMRQETLN